MNDRTKIVLIYITFLVLAIPLVFGFVLSEVAQAIVGGTKKAINHLKPKETTEELWEQFKKGKLDE